ncbi:MAG: hypothetical protein B7Y99_02480 [Caulobacterales bacterium 32-69-10]|nr:MAG: hypothetical protein B7Y99_02480 [Caulobacterales bacterium 32-69-10]
MFLEALPALGAVGLAAHAGGDAALAVEDGLDEAGFGVEGADADQGAAAADALGIDVGLFVRVAGSFRAPSRPPAAPPAAAPTSAPTAVEASPPRRPS